MKIIYPKEYSKLKNRLCGRNLIGFTPFSRFDITRLRWAGNKGF